MVSWKMDFDICRCNCEGEPCFFWIFLGYKKDLEVSLETQTPATPNDTYLSLEPFKALELSPKSHR